MTFGIRQPRLFRAALAEGSKSSAEPSKISGVHAALGVWLFYDFCLDRHVSFDHMLKAIDRHLTLTLLAKVE
jgi:hypothetical protein